MKNEQNSFIPINEKASSCCGSDCCSEPTSPTDAQDLKALVQDKYGAIARRAAGAAACCGDSMDYSIMADEYGDLTGYAPDADLKLGCGLPTEFAKIQPGQTVVDLGSGAGNDCFVARAETGPTGQVIGVDFTDDMLRKARANALKMGYNNVSFVKGDIENIPLPDATADVVVSNCVFNLVPDKRRAFAETYRILKPGGHFSISDIVLEGDLPLALQKDAEMYAGCVAGAIQMTDYLNLLQETSFQHLTIQKKKPIVLPAEVLARHLTPAGIADFSNRFGIYSITVYGEV
ncbi:MAG: arsenite S-adenosylmethyltransferase [Bacteroidetes bacterium]|nr:MAG: arsenite S-adenosylmethyltransferase [Bacteroidota bacterium]PTM14518.1 MAG: arsenite S-adenosylmethyltransferase [Bacteroidota bacterium]